MFKALADIMTLNLGSMNIYIKYSLIALLIVILSIIIIGWITPNIICRYPAPMSPINTSIGKSFSISLPSNPTTGYSWKVVRIDKTMLDLTNEDYKPPKSGLIGAGGIQIWQFKPIKKGKTILKLAYQRPWENKKPLKTAAYCIYIR